MPPETETSDALNSVVESLNPNVKAMDPTFVAPPFHT